MKPILMMEPVSGEPLSAGVPPAVPELQADRARAPTVSAHVTLTRPRRQRNDPIDDPICDVGLGRSSGPADMGGPDPGYGGVSANEQLFVQTIALDGVVSRATRRKPARNLATIPVRSTQLGRRLRRSDAQPSSAERGISVAPDQCKGDRKSVV